MLQPTTFYAQDKQLLEHRITMLCILGWIIIDPLYKPWYSRQWRVKMSPENNR